MATHHGFFRPSRGIGSGKKNQSRRGRLTIRIEKEHNPQKSETVMLVSFYGWYLLLD